MSQIGLEAAENLRDLGSVTTAWNNLGAGVTYASGASVVTLQLVAGDMYAASGAACVPTADLLLLRNLSDRVQPRMTTISGLVASGIGLRDKALRKLNPTSSGYFGVTEGVLSGTALQVNGVAVTSLSTTPFTGTTAISPIKLDTIKLSTNVRWAQPVVSGTLASGVKAIPVQYGGFIMYVKAG